MNDSLPLVSLVIPAFNEAAVLTTFYERLCGALTTLDGRARFELMFVNNGSTDETIRLLSKLRESDPRVYVLTLSRNFSYQAAITAGLTHARGDAVACIDSDGEDPPEVLCRFVEAWLLGGVDVVYGIRGRRPESELMQLARRVYDRLTRALADHDIVLDMAEFALLDRRVRDAVLTTKSTFPFVRGQVGFVGFRRQGIDYNREVRLGGKSHYNLWRAFEFGLAGILSSSTFPLRLVAYGGSILLVTVAVFVCWALFDARVAASPIVWNLLWTVLFAWISFGIGVLSIYVARIYKDQVGLPLYVVDRKRSILPESDEQPRTH